MSEGRHGEKILVMGTGNFGTCLAQHLAEQGYHVTMWTRSTEVADFINSNRKNPKYLQTITLSPRISATDNLSRDLLANVSAVLMSVPTQAMRQVLDSLKPFLLPRHLLVCANKGIEMLTLKLPTQIIAEVLGEDAGRNAVTMSGPSFATEVVARQPTAVVAASAVQKRSFWTQQLFHAAHFRVYTGSDPIGVEIAGALKNVIAIAAGACAGLGMQNNARAALITRGLAEISRIGVALGANPLTFNGLSGVGDLFLTCTSEKSRNFTVGFRMGKGESLEQVIESMGSTAEGMTTAQGAYELGARLGVATPITEQVYLVMYEGKPIAQAVIDLVTRDAKPEMDPIVEAKL